MMNITFQCTFLCNKYKLHDIKFPDLKQYIHHHQRKTYSLHFYIKNLHNAGVKVQLRATLDDHQENKLESTEAFY